MNKSLKIWSPFLFFPFLNTRWLLLATRLYISSHFVRYKYTFSLQNIKEVYRLEQAKHSNKKTTLHRDQFPKQNLQYVMVEVLIVMISILNAKCFGQNQLKIYLPMGKQDSSSGIDSSSVTDHMYNSYSPWRSWDRKSNNEIFTQANGVVSWWSFRWWNERDKYLQCQFRLT